MEIKFNLIQFNFNLKEIAEGQRDSLEYQRQLACILTSQSGKIAEKTAHVGPKPSDHYANSFLVISRPISGS